MNQELTVELAREVLLKHAAEIFEMAVVPEHGFLALGGDSIHAVELLFRVEEALKVNIDPVLLYEVLTFDELADAIVEGSKGGVGR